MWQNYDAAKRTGDFYISSEELAERTPTDDGYPPYEITLPLDGVAQSLYWTWDAGQTTPAGSLRGASRPQGKAVSLIVTGVTGSDTEATATVSNGNGSCGVPSDGSTATLPHLIRETDCEKETNATWTKANPYTVCIDTDHADLFDVTPKPANQMACEATTGNKWYAGTVLDHRQGNNTATLTARGGIPHLPLWHRGGGQLPANQAG